MRSLSAFLLVLALAACGGGGGTTTGGDAESACEAAFREAAAVDVMADTVEDLDAAVRACATEDEWRAASDAYPDALDGAPAGEFLRNRCSYEPALADTTLCQSVE